MKDDILALTGLENRPGVAEVRLNRRDTGVFEMRISMPSKGDDLIAPGMEHSRNSAPEESTAAGHEGPHLSRLAAQIASASRSILAL